jgi:hypothetical protein
MKSIIIILLLATCLGQSVFGQTRNNYSDDLLTSSFKLFQSADFELANHMLPFIREKFVKELNDTSSFTNRYDSLSNYIGIKHSSDSLLKIYCWSERSGSCCHTSATFAQFKTKSGEIKYLDLETPENDGNEIFITDLQRIEINNEPLYLVLGWGTCCGGKHYQVARIYQITDETLVQVDAVFNNESTLFIGANRSQKIELKYSLDTMTLSYNSFVFDDDIGFYTDEKSVVKWKLKKTGFEKIN